MSGLDLEQEIRAFMSEHGLDTMPTAPRLAAAGRHQLVKGIIRKCGGFDLAAKMFGIPLSQHASRVGWAAEDWVAELLEHMGAAVERRPHNKSPWDLRVNGHTVDVKTARASVWAGGKQWTWRVARARHVVDFYILRAEDVETHLFVRPAEDTPLTCVTARFGQRLSWGRHAKWLDRFDLLGVTLPGA